MTNSALRTATWWANPEIPSQYAGLPRCWSFSLGVAQEVQIATSGTWAGKKMNMKGTYTGNHTKLGHSLNGTLAIMGDMNQQGSYTPSHRECNSSQIGRGGLFFVVSDAVLHKSIQSLLKGDTADYVPSPGLTPPPTPTPPTPSGSCGGAGTRVSTCKSPSTPAMCVYVSAKDQEVCGVSKWGCYDSSTLPASCPDKKTIIV